MWAKWEKANEKCIITEKCVLTKGERKPYIAS